MGRLSKLQRLSASERRTLGRAALYLVAVYFALRILPFPRISEWASGNEKSPSRGQVDRDEIFPSVCRLVDVAARNLPLELTCLPRCLVLQRLLAERGLRTRLEIGVRREGDSIAAHAWLESGGSPLGEPEAVSERFLRLLRVDPPSTTRESGR